MPFQRGKANPGKGGRRPGAGRKKGVPNRATVELREFFKNFLELNRTKLQAAFTRLLKNDPGKAFDVFNAMSEFVVPKLARVEHTGADGKDLPPPIFMVEYPAGAPGLPAPAAGGATYDADEADAEAEAATQQPAPRAPRH